MLQGVTEYTTGILTVEVHFPVGLKGCQNCIFKRYRQIGLTTRVICSQTYENLDYIDRLHERGKDCPLVFEKE